MTFVTLDGLKMGLQNPLNVQRLLTNVEKIIKCYLQRFFTYLSTLPYYNYNMFFLNKHTPNILSHILHPKKISIGLYKDIFFKLLVTTLYFMSNMQWNIDFCSLNNYSKNKSYQSNFIFYRPF
jgi:hypothetical protein